MFALMRYCLSSTLLFELNISVTYEFELLEEKEAGERDRERERERERDRQTDRQTDIQTDRQTDKQRQTEKRVAI